MSPLPVIILISLALFVWGVAIWASLEEEQERPEEPQQKEKEMKPEAEDRSTHGRKAS